jgi:hypothetical protein
VKFFHCCCALFILIVTAGPAPAQVVAGPPGTSGGLFGGHRPVDPNRASQRLTLNFDLSGGYDNNAEGAAGAPLGELVPVYASTAESLLRYWRGKSNRFIEASARSFVNYESTAREQLLGGEGLLMGAATLGSKLQLTGGAQAMLEPSFLSRQFDAGLGELTAPLAEPRSTPQGLVQQRWLAQSGYLNAAVAWSARHSTSIVTRAQFRRPIDGEGLESETQEGSIAHSWNFNPSSGLQGSYRFENSLQTETSRTRSYPALQTQTADVGVHFAKRFSSIRTLGFDVNGGAAYGMRLRTDFETGASSTRSFVLPVASASMRMGLTRVWSFMIDGSRDVSVLEGITAESFVTSTGTIRLDAAVSRRLRMAFSGIYTEGTGRLTGAGSFQTSSARAQLQYGFGPCCGIFTSYGFYNHNLRDISRLPIGYPPQYNAHNIRVGFTWWLPLYGSF